MTLRRPDTAAMVVGAILAAAVVVLAAAAGASRPEAADAIRLHYRLQPGATYEQVVTMVLVMQVEMESASAEAAAMTAAMGKDMKQEMSLKMLLDVGRPDGEGGVPFVGRVTEVKAAMTVAGQRIEMPGLEEAVSSGSAVTRGRLLPGGRALEMDLEGVETLPGVSPEVKQRLSQAMPEFPDRPLEVGDAFEVPMKVSMPGLPVEGTLDMDAKTTYRLKALGDAEAVFDVRTTLSVATGGGVSKTMPLRLSGGSSGTATFDRLEGIFTSLRMEMKMDASLDLGAAAAGGGPRRGESNSAALSGPSGDPSESSAGQAEAGSPSRAMKIKMSMQGPVEFTMTRREAAP